jgi:hypothetical protein
MNSRGRGRRETPLALNPPRAAGRLQPASVPPVALCAFRTTTPCAAGGSDRSGVGFHFLLGMMSAKTRNPTGARERTGSLRTSSRPDGADVKTLSATCAGKCSPCAGCSSRIRPRGDRIRDEHLPPAGRRNGHPYPPMRKAAATDGGAVYARPALVRGARECWVLRGSARKSRPETVPTDSKYELQFAFTPPRSPRRRQRPERRTVGGEAVSERKGTAAILCVLAGCG